MEHSAQVELPGRERRRFCCAGVSGADFVMVVSVSLCLEIPVPICDLSFCYYLTFLSFIIPKDMKDCFVPQLAKVKSQPFVFSHKGSPFEKENPKPSM